MQPCAAHQPAAHAPRLRSQASPADADAILARDGPADGPADADAMLAREGPAFLPPLPRQPAGPVMTTPYGDVVREDSGTRVQQATLGALAAVSLLTAPLDSPNPMGAAKEVAGRVLDAFAMLGVSAGLRPLP